MQAATVPTPGQTDRDTGACRAVALCFALDGALRFLSHHDELRMLTRALRRARWPLAASRLR